MLFHFQSGLKGLQDQIIESRKRSRQNEDEKDEKFDTDSKSKMRGGKLKNKNKFRNCHWQQSIIFN